MPSNIFRQRLEIAIVSCKVIHENEKPKIFGTARQDYSSRDASIIHLFRIEPVPMRSVASICKRTGYVNGEHKPDPPEKYFL